MLKKLIIGFTPLCICR